jgi:membrane protease YdiL (CAAX protease family)
MMFLGGDFPLLSEWSGTLLTVYANAMHLSAYDVSVNARPRIQLGSNSHFAEQSERKKSSDVVQLLTAPFSRKILDPLVWIPSIIGPAVLTTFYALEEFDGTTSIAASGNGYIGNAMVAPLWAGAYALGKGAIDMLAISVGEEAYFRGVIYDNLKYRLGTGAAMAIDAVLFPLVHLTGDVQSGFKDTTIVFNFFWRSAMTLVFDAAYDKGGLPLAIGVHFWSDLLLVMSKWWFYGGSMG